MERNFIYEAALAFTVVGSANVFPKSLFDVMTGRG